MLATMKPLKNSFKTIQAFMSTLPFMTRTTKSRDDRALRAIAKISDIVIVHDANFEEVTTMCQGIFGNKEFELHGNEYTEADSRIYTLNKTDKWQIQ